MAMTLALPIVRPRVTADYDRDVDVLYIIMGEARPIEGDGLSRGVELDYALDDDTACGVTVIGFRENGWPETLAELSKIASDHLSVSTTIIDQALTAAVGLRQQR